MDQEDKPAENGSATKTFVREDEEPQPYTPTKAYPDQQGDSSQNAQEHIVGDSADNVENDPVLQDISEPSSGESGDTVVRNDYRRSPSPNRSGFETPQKEEHRNEGGQSPEYSTDTSVREDRSINDSAFASPVSEESFGESSRTEDFFSPVMQEQLDEAEAQGDGFLDTSGNAELLRTISGGDSHQENVEGVSESCSAPYVPDIFKPAEVATETSTVVRDTDTTIATAVAEEKLAKEEAESEWQDLVGNGKLMKRTIRRGAPDSRPERGSEVTIRCSAKVVDDGFDDMVHRIVDNHESLQFTVGNTEVIQGLDLAALLMDVGEIAELKIQPRFGYGEPGFPESGIPPDATLLYTVELLKSDPPVEVENLGVSDRIRVANHKIDRGNFWYSRKEVVLALGLYQKAVNVLETPVDRYMTPEDVVQLSSAKGRAYGNLSSAQVEEKIWDESLRSVTNAIKYDPNNGKLLVRKIRIHREKGDYEAACAVCEDVFQKGSLVAESFAKKAREEYDSLKKKKQKSDADEKAMYQRMMGTSRPQSNGSNRNSRAPSRSPPPVGSSSSTTWMIVAGAAAVAALGVAVWYRYYQQHH